MGQSGITSQSRWANWGDHALVFTGTFEHTIDAKNRLAIPSEIRALLEPANAGATGNPEAAGGSVFLYVTLSEGQVLSLYPEAAFAQRARELDNSELDPAEILEYERVMFSLTRRVELDKQGRVRLPEELLKMTKLGTDVVLLGVKDHLEIRDRQAWLDHVQQVLARQPGLLVNPRQLMRKK